MELIDIGANLTSPAFRDDLDAVLERARAAEISQIVVTGTDVEASRAACALASANSGSLFATAGVHPHHASDFDAAATAALRELASSAQVVAIGETGLDFFRDFSPRPVQEAVFEAQLELAAGLAMPVFLHQRDAHARFIDILRAWRDKLPGAVLHCFTGDADQLRDCLDLDLHVGITGWICDERRGRHLLELAPALPADRYMVETDSPYLLPRDLDPKPASRRNEPMYLAHIAARLAQSRGESLAQVAAATTANARRFFGLPLPSPPRGISHR